MDDPFPPSLPGYESPQPRIFDSGLTETMEDIKADFYTDYASPGSLFGEQTMSNPAYSPTPHKSTDNAPTTSSRLAGPNWSNSPESSSSSDSSNRHERKNSSESSAMGDLTMADTPIANGILIGADPVDANLLDDEASNKFMASAFDFESAASSPTPISDAKAGLERAQSNGIKMPVRSVPIVKPAGSYTSRSSGSSGSPEAGLSMMIQHDQTNGPHGNANQQQLESSCSPSDLMMTDAAARNARFPHSGPWSGHNVPAVAPMQNYHQPRMAMPYASPGVAPPKTPQLYVSNFIAKTRVETQHMLKYTLDPLPPGITKLHLQPYTMSKPKLMAKPTPERSSDMLEMFATVVCSSAMEDSTKRERAFARARGPLENQEEHRPSLVKDMSPEDEAPEGPVEEDWYKPLNGGPVKICNGCIERERRRAERKKVINAEEQEEWQRVEAQRTVVFNISEVREWQEPSPPKIVAGKEKTMPVPYYDSEPAFSPSAMQVDIPTRISCYCRHQEEKIGFRIIFTVRDYKDNVVAQAMSNSIMITDDHKTHPAPNALQQSQMAQQSQMGSLPGAGVFQQAPNNYHPAAPFARNAFSATDLPRINQNFDPRMTNPSRQFAMPQETSEATSTTLTPRNLSRPASPTSFSSQQNKRRKASGSSKMRNDLMMTKFSNGPLKSPTSATSAAPPVGSFFAASTGPATFSSFSPNYAEPPGAFSIPPASLQYNHTNPPTPSAAESSFSPNMVWAQRSQSMENLTQSMVSATSSAQPSRVPSPRMGNALNPSAQPGGLPNGPGYQTNGLLQQQHAQMLTNSLHSVNAATSPQTPVILNLNPTEGPVAGGIQVTCLGTGFTQGLEVMFGDARATTTTYWGENALVCLVPPAVQAGTVAVTFKHHYDQNIALPPGGQKYFKYVEDDQQEIMRMMLTIMGRNLSSNNNGQPRDFLGEVRNMAQNALSNGVAPAPNGGSHQGTESQRQHLASAASVSKAEMEEVLVKCLEQMDLDESPGQANLNFRGPNGQTMLHLAASLGYYRVAAGLLARQANPDVRDNNGMSPMHMASLRSNVRVIRKLRSVGGDPTLRSLNGFTPADMTTAQEVQDAINALDQHTRSRSAVATPNSGLSRAPSVLSRVSSIGDYNYTGLPNERAANMKDLELYRSHPVTPAQMRARSRRNSFTAEDHDLSETTQKALESNASQLATQSALTAWRDQLSLQIQQFQQTVHRALPPLPNLPDYQDYPVVRRISSLVPQRNAPLASGSDGSDQAKETDYHWWELLTGATSAPPAYEDIYPEISHQDLSNKKAPILRAAGEAFMDQKCEAMFDHAEGSAIMETVRIGSKGLTQEQQDRLRSAHAQKIKRLRSDRNLFFIWIPLLIIVVLAMLKDRAPQLVYAARQTYSYLRGRFQGRIVEEVI